MARQLYNKEQLYNIAEVKEFAKYGTAEVGDVLLYNNSSGQMILLDDLELINPDDYTPIGMVVSSNTDECTVVSFRSTDYVNANEGADENVAMYWGNRALSSNSDMDGKANTEAILELATAQEDWKTRVYTPAVTEEISKKPAEISWEFSSDTSGINYNEWEEILDGVTISPDAFVNYKSKAICKFTGKSGDIIKFIISYDQNGLGTSVDLYIGEVDTQVSQTNYKENLSKSGKKEYEYSVNDEEEHYIQFLCSGLYSSSYPITITITIEDVTETTLIAPVVNSLDNKFDVGYYPAACSCWRFSTPGTNQGQWYLPSSYELSNLNNIIVKKIDNQTISDVQKYFPNIVPISGIYWSSTYRTNQVQIYNINSMGVALQTSFSVSDSYFVRPFIKGTWDKYSGIPATPDNPTICYSFDETETDSNLNKLSRVNNPTSYNQIVAENDYALSDVIITPIVEVDGCTYTVTGFTSNAIINNISLAGITLTNITQNTTIQTTSSIRCNTTDNLTFTFSTPQKLTINSKVDLNDIIGISISGITVYGKTIKFAVARYAVSPECVPSVKIQLQVTRLGYSGTSTSYVSKVIINETEYSTTNLPSVPSGTTIDWSIVPQNASCYICSGTTRITTSNPYINPTVIQSGTTRVNLSLSKGASVTINGTTYSNVTGSYTNYVNVDNGLVTLSYGTVDENYIISNVNNTATYKNTNNSFYATGTAITITVGTTPVTYPLTVICDPRLTNVRVTYTDSTGKSTTTTCTRNTILYAQYGTNATYSVTNPNSSKYTVTPNSGTVSITSGTNKIEPIVTIRTYTISLTLPVGVDYITLSGTTKGDITYERTSTSSTNQIITTESIAEYDSTITWTAKAKRGYKVTNATGSITISTYNSISLTVSPVTYSLTLKFNDGIYSIKVTVVNPETGANVLNNTYYASSYKNSYPDGYPLNAGYGNLTWSATKETYNYTLNEPSSGEFFLDEETEGTVISPTATYTPQYYNLTVILGSGVASATISGVGTYTTTTTVRLLSGSYTISGTKDSSVTCEGGRVNSQTISLTKDMSVTLNPHCPTYVNIPVYINEGIASISAGSYAGGSNYGTFTSNSSIRAEAGTDIWYRVTVKTGYNSVTSSSVTAASGVSISPTTSLQTFSGYVNLYASTTSRDKCESVTIDGTTYTSDNRWITLTLSYGSHSYAFNRTCDTGCFSNCDNGTFTVTGTSSLTNPWITGSCSECDCTQTTHDLRLNIAANTALIVNGQRYTSSTTITIVDGDTVTYSVESTSNCYNASVTGTISSGSKLTTDGQSITTSSSIKKFNLTVSVCNGVKSVTINGSTNWTSPIQYDCGTTVTWSAEIEDGYVLEVKSGTIIMNDDQILNVCPVKTPRKLSLTIGDGVEYVTINGSRYPGSVKNTTLTFEDGTVVNWSAKALEGYTITPSSGSITMNSDQSLVIDGVPTKYKIQITVPTGCKQINVYVNNSTSAAGTFSSSGEMEVQYGYSIRWEAIAESGYTMSPSSGSFTVDGDKTIAPTAVPDFGSGTRNEFTITIASSGSGRILSIGIEGSTVEGYTGVYTLTGTGTMKAHSGDTLTVKYCTVTNGYEASYEDSYQIIKNTTITITISAIPAEAKTITITNIPSSYILVYLVTCKSLTSETGTKYPSYQVLPDTHSTTAIRYGGDCATQKQISVDERPIWYACTFVNGTAVYSDNLFAPGDTKSW